ncbi:MAG: replicative DNA helicase [Phycisphaeraceae bacterium]|nr:replicative DNA helicase [Phycisphaeraceae bacterium]
MSLLGALILDPKVVADVIQIIRTGDAFYAPAHAAIYDAIVTNYDFHQSGDIVQLAESLKQTGALDAVGGVNYLVRLGEAVPSTTSAPHYARIVAENARLRRLIDAAGQMLYDAHHAGDFGPDGAREVLDKAERLIFEIAEQSQTNDAEHLKELLHRALEILESSEGRAVTGVATGYPDLDEMTSGLQPGELVIVAARPSMGKTALALNLAEQIALSGAHGKRAPVAFFSLEMSRQAVASRIMCARSGVDSHLVRTNRLNEEHYRKLIQACGDLAEAPIYIDDTPSMTILALRARARRLAAQHGVKCIMIDYLQLLTAPGSARESRQVEVSAISRGIKALARELDVPVVCLAQLNRGSEQREGHKPRMSDLRESGSIEQDADVIALLHREEYYHAADPEWAEENPERVGMAELIIAKQRNGPTGTVNLVWDNRTTRFKPHAGYGYTHQSAHYEPKPAYSAPAPSTSSSFARPEAPFDPTSAPRSAPDERRDWDDEDIDDLPI